MSLALPAWPAVMSIEMAAAYLGFDDRRALVRAIGKGEAPAPTAKRMGKPVWFKCDMDNWLAPRARTDSDTAALDLSNLI